MKQYIGKAILDIKLVGSVEAQADDVCEGLLNYENIYIELEEGFLKLMSDTDKSELSIEIEKKIKLSFEIDEDDKFLQLSIIDLLVLDTVSSIRLTKIKKYLVNDVLKGVELILNDKESIFIDGTYFTGMKVGSDNIKQDFFRNHSELITQEFT